MEPEARGHWVLIFLAMAVDSVCGCGDSDQGQMRQLQLFPGCDGS